MKAVKYTGDIPFADMHNGVQYVFEPGQVTKLPDEAARHFFGIGGNADDLYLAKRRSPGGVGLSNPKWIKQFVELKVETQVIDPQTQKKAPEKQGSASQ
jgi:hypothetical protein